MKDKIYWLGTGVCYANDISGDRVFNASLGIFGWRTEAWIGYFQGLHCFFWWLQSVLLFYVIYYEYKK